MPRDQFTFYRSFWESIKLMKKPADRLSIMEAIAAYALDEEQRTLTETAASNFLLIKPVLDASAKKAKAGRAGGTSKQRSKPEANGKQMGHKNGSCSKQTGSEEEVEEEVEVEEEEEVENECSQSSPLGEVACAHARDSLPATGIGSDEYYRKIGKTSLRMGWGLSPSLVAWMEGHPEEAEAIRAELEAEDEGKQTLPQAAVEENLEELNS